MPSLILVSGGHRLAASKDSNYHAFDDQRIFLDVDLDGFEVRVLGHEPYHRAFLLVALDRDFVFQARHDDLPIAHFRRTMHGHEVAIENAGIFHRHTDHLQEVVRLGLEDAGVDVEPGFDILLGEDGTARGNATDERQTQLLAHGVHELDATRGARHERDDTFAR